MDRELRAFLAVVRFGNLTAAADSVGLTQPALTKTIRRLEDEVGARLFERLARGMALTEAGQLFLARARAIEMNWTQAREEVQARLSGRLSRFHIAAGAAYRSWIAPQLVRRLMAEFPETRLVLESDLEGAMVPGLRTGEIDLLLGAFLHEPPEGIVTQRLMQVESGVLCWKGHPLAGLDEVPPEAMQDYRWVICNRDLETQRRLDAYFLQHRLPAPQVMLEIDTRLPAMQILDGTNFLMAAPTPAAVAFGLVPLRLREPIWSFPSGAWMRASTRHYPILGRSLEILAELVEEQKHSRKLS